MEVIVLKSQIQQWSAKRDSTQARGKESWSCLSSFHPRKPLPAPKGWGSSAAAVLSCRLLLPSPLLNTLWIFQGHIPIFLTILFPAIWPPHHGLGFFQSVPYLTLKMATFPDTCNKPTQALNNKDEKKKWAPWLFQVGAVSCAACPADYSLQEGSFLPFLINSRENTIRI